jgi:hypothetical protein
MTGGTWHARDRIPLRMHKPLVALVKRLAGMDPAITGQPQSGALAAKVDDTRVTFPVRLKSTGDGDAITIDLPVHQAGMIAAIKRRLHTPKVRLIDPTGQSPLDVLSSQSAAGAFALLPADVAARAADVRRALETLPDVNATIVTDLVLQTALCLLSLQTTHAARRDLWSRAHAKGVRYVAMELGVKPEEVTTLLEQLAKAPAGAAV